MAMAVAERGAKAPGRGCARVRRARLPRGWGGRVWGLGQEARRRGGRGGSEGIRRGSLGGETPNNCYLVAVARPPVGIKGLGSRRDAAGPRRRCHARSTPFVCLASKFPNSFEDKSESRKVSKDVRKRVETAVERLKYEVTIGDVASSSGVSLLEAERALQALAVDSQGTLKVTRDGEILYSYPKNFRSVVRSKSVAIRLEPGIAKTKAVAAYLVRVGFGTALIASIAIVFAAIIVISTSSSNDRDNRRSSSSSSLPMMFRISPFDLYYPYWDPYYYRRRRERLAYGEEMNTLEAIFSFVFGDGDPNEGLESAKWEAIGQVIRRSKGVVTAEQLAPFVIGEAREEDPNNPLDRESFVLPVLQKFDGRAEVDESGNIVYCFPELQKTAGSQVPSDVASKYGYLREEGWQFTKAASGQVAAAVGLGLVNVFGIASLTNILANSAITTSQIAQTYGGVVALAINLLPFLKVYAAGFFAIPLLRWLFNRNTNKDIETRNARRLIAYQKLKQMEPGLRNKLRSARRYADTQVISDRGAVYTSDTDLEQAAMDDFDAKLGEK